MSKFLTNKYNLRKQMDQNGIQFRKEREMGEVISDSFRFIKQEYKLLGRITLIYVLPFIILYSIGQIYIQMKLVNFTDYFNPENMIDNLRPMYTSLSLTLLFNLFVQSLFVGAIYSYIAVYIEKGKGNFTIEDIAPQLFSNSLLAFGVNLVLAFSVLFGLALCIIPGLYFANTLSLTLMIAISEKKGFGYSFRKSLILVNSKWWDTLGLNISAVVIIWAAGLVISIPSMIAGVSTSIASLQGGEASFPDWYWYLMGFNTVISSLFYVVLYVFLAFQYHNLNEKFTKLLSPPKSDF